MILLNELTDLKCNKREVMESVVVLLTPFAPHIAEELWHQFGHDTTVLDAAWPTFDEKYLVESAFNYPISFNGKTRFTLELPLDMDKAAIEKAVLENEQSQKYLEGKTIAKVIVVPGKIVNVALKG